MQGHPEPATAAAAAPRAAAVAEFWHRIECWIAVVAFAFIALILLLDVLGRELVGPAIRLLGFPATATGIFASQKLSIFALVIGSFAGIGIATATASHLVPRVGFGWIPAHWEPWFNRVADLLTGLFLVGVAYYGWVFVESSMTTDLRAPVLDWSVWPIQLAIPIGFLSAAGRYLMYAAWPAIKPRPPEFQE
jgi:TRAP-type C4-dicarboxylate transport system permease small subunit